MKQPVIIGIGYKSRNGKDTVAQTIQNHYKDQYNIQTFSFARALKEEVNGLDQFQVCIEHGIPYDFDPPMDDPYCQTQHGKQRELLQFWGMHRRKQNPFYWVQKNAVAIAASGADVVLIPDTRFINEVQWVKSKEGFLVKVSRIGFHGLVGSAGQHESETQLDGYLGWDYEISVPEGQLDELYKDALFVFDHIAKSLDPVVLTETEMQAA